MFRPSVPSGQQATLSHLLPALHQTEKSPAKTAPNRMSKQPPYASLSRRMQFLVYGISTRLPRPTGPNSTPRRSAGPKQLPSPLAVCTRVRLHAPKTVRQKSQYNYKPQQSQACPFHIEPPCLHLAAQNTHTAALPEKIIVLPGPGHKSPRVKAPSRSVKTGNCVSPSDVFSFCA